MTYYNRDGFGQLATTAPRRVSVVQYMQGMPSRPNIPVPLAAVAAIRERHLRKIQALQTLLRAPAAIFRRVPASVTKAFGGLDALHGVAEDAANRANEFANLPIPDIDSIGTSMLISRGSEIASSLGIPISYDDLLESTQNQLALLDGYTALPGGAAAQALVQTLFGGHVADSFLGQGETASKLVGIANEMRSKFGSAWGDITNVMGDLSGIMDGGVRSVMEELTSAIPGETSEWLNRRSVESVVGIARTWSSEVDYARPGSIMTGAGGTISLVGVACPPPANAIVAAVGTVVSIVGALLDWLIGTEEPLPEAKVCEYTTLEDPDAWAMLRLFAFASDEIGADESMTDVARAGPRGWGARFDPYTGEVLVQRPGTSVYKRVLDAFDRNVLLEAYESGKFDSWLLGRQSIQGADPINVAGSAWLAGGTSESRRALYCWLRPRDVMQRGFLSDKCSTARRFRVYENEFDKNANTRVDHGPTAIGWRGRMDQAGTGLFWRNYRGAMLVSAFLGGTTPYGQYDLGFICTGVGGKINPVTGENWLPFATQVGPHPEIRVFPPAPRNMASYAPSPSSPSQHLPASPVMPLSFSEVAQEIVRNDAQRVAWSVPGTSPQAGEIATFPMMYTAPIILHFPGDVSKTEPTPGMSTGKKLAIAGGAVIIVGGVVYAISRGGKK